MAGNDELVRAAGEARAKAAQAHESLVQAHLDCDQKAAGLTAVKAQIAADREALATAMEELGRATGEAMGRLEMAVDQAAQAFAEVAATADGLAEVGPRILAAEASELAEAAGSVAKVDAAIDQVLANLNDMHRVAFERIDSASHQLDEATDRAGSILRGDPIQTLQRLRPVLETLLTEALTLLETTLPEALTDRVEEWDKRRGVILERAGEAFAGMIAHADEVAVHTGGTFVSILGAERESQQAAATALAGELNGLASSLGSRRAEMESALSALADRFESEQADLRTVTAELEAVRGRWATFGFGS